MLSAEFRSLVDIVPRDKIPQDGQWICPHNNFGLSCENLKCRYVARMIEVLNRHCRLATEKRKLEGKKFPGDCYFDLRYGTDEEIKSLVNEWNQVKKAFIAAGLKSI